MSRNPNVGDTRHGRQSHRAKDSYGEVYTTSFEIIMTSPFLSADPFVLVDKGMKPCL